MSWWYLLVAVALLLANGFFVGAEFALTAARRARLEALAEKGDIRAKPALASVRNLSFMLAGAQLGITMMSLGLGFVAEPAVARLIESGIERFAELPTGLLHTISFVVAMTLVVFFHMVIGEMAPKNIAIAEPERTALWLALPFRAYVVLFGPIIRALNVLANGGLRLMRVEPSDELHGTHTAVELRSMIDESAREGMLGSLEYRLLSGAITLPDLDAAASMVARTEMVAVPVDLLPAELEGWIVGTGHSRLPVYENDLDQVIGFIHAKDLLAITPEQRDRPFPRRLIRPMLVVPESRKLLPLLLDMKRERKHFALVLDEHGGTAGVITIEDLVEELVGEIRDEYDVTEAGIEQLEDGRFVIPGALRIDEAADRIGLHLPEGEYETVAGFLMDRLGHVPKRRDAITHNGWKLQVRSMHRNRVVDVLAERSSEIPKPTG